MHLIRFRESGGLNSIRTRHTSYDEGEEVKKQISYLHGAIFKYE